MITLTTVVYVFLFLLGAGLIFGLMWFLVNYFQKEFPDSPPLIFKVLRIFLVATMVLVLIGLILDMMGHPIVTWR